MSGRRAEETSTATGDATGMDTADGGRPSPRAKADRSEQQSVKRQREASAARLRDGSEERIDDALETGHAIDRAQRTQYAAVQLIEIGGGTLEAHARALGVGPGAAGMGLGFAADRRLGIAGNGASEYSDGIDDVDEDEEEEEEEDEEEEEEEDDDEKGIPQH